MFRQRLSRFSAAAAARSCSSRIRPATTTAAVAAASPLYCSRAPFATATAEGDALVVGNAAIGVKSAKDFIYRRNEFVGTLYPRLPHRRASAGEVLALMDTTASRAAFYFLHGYVCGSAFKVVQIPKSSTTTQQQQQQQQPKGAVEADEAEEEETIPMSMTTASFNSITFQNLFYEGDLIVCEAKVVYCRTSSLGVKVTARRQSFESPLVAGADAAAPSQDEIIAECFLTQVLINGNRISEKIRHHVPAVRLEDEKEKKDFHTYCKLRGWSLQFERRRRDVTELLSSTRRGADVPAWPSSLSPEANPTAARAERAPAEETPEQHAQHEKRQQDIATFVGDIKENIIAQYRRNHKDDVDTAAPSQAKKDAAIGAKLLEAGDFEFGENKTKKRWMKIHDTTTYADITFGMEHVNVNHVVYSSAILTFLERAALHCGRTFAQDYNVHTFTMFDLNYKRPLRQKEFARTRSQVLCVKYSTMLVSVELVAEFEGVRESVSRALFLLRKVEPYHDRVDGVKLSAQQQEALRRRPSQVETGIDYTGATEEEHLLYLYGRLVMETAVEMRKEVLGEV